MNGLTSAATRLMEGRRKDKSRRLVHSELLSSQVREPLRRLRLLYMYTCRRLEKFSINLMYEEFNESSPVESATGGERRNSPDRVGDPNGARGTGLPANLARVRR